MSAYDDIQPLMKKAIDLLIVEFVAQGHHLTNKFEESLEGFIETAENITITIKGNHYGKYLELGVPAAKIPYKQGSGAKSSKYIDALMNYARLRFNLTAVSEQKSAAFAIAKKQKLYGMPTPGSYKYTKTGKRTDFIEETIKKFKADRTVESTIFKIYEGKIINVIRELNTAQ